MASQARLNRQRSKRVARVRSAIRRGNRDNKKRIFFSVSARHVYAQIIDDQSGKTLLSVSTLDKALNPGKGKSAKNKSFCEKLAESLVVKMQAAKLNHTDAFVFDRGARLYHGRVATFADKLREKGLKI